MQALAHFIADSITDWYGADAQTLADTLAGKHGAEWKARAEARVAELAGLALEELAK